MGKRTIILFITTSLPFLIWSNVPVYAIAGNLNIETSAATSSGWLVLGNEKSLRPAYGPLILDYKSDPDTWSAGLVIREVTGNVGIGTTSPTSKLKVNGAVEGASFIDTANSSYFLDPANGGNSLAVAGNVGIGTATPSAKLDVAGSAVLGSTTLTGNLVLSGNANEGISGGGLTNCTGTSNKLLWDQSTNKFSCGTDQAGNEVFIEKDTDEIVNNSNTLQNDDELTYTMAANTAYAVEGSIHYTSPTANPDFKYTFITPSGATIYLTSESFTTSSNVETCVINSSATTCVFAGNVAPDWTITVHGVVQTAATTGALQFQWAQNSARSEDTTVKKNSWMRITPLSGAADLAEIYETDDPTLSAGEVVAIDPVKASWVKKSQRAYDTMMLGVVSTKPAQLMGSATGGGIPVPVALSGRVPVKIAPDSAPIASGDFLTSSNIQGRAMKATKAGPVVARALEFWSCAASAREHLPGESSSHLEGGGIAEASCTDRIEAFIHLGSYDPLLTLTDTGDLDIVFDQQRNQFNIREHTTGAFLERIGAFSKLIVADANAGLLRAKKLIVGDLDVADTIDRQEQELEELRTVVERQQERINQQEIRILNLETKVSVQQ